MRERVMGRLGWPVGEIGYGMWGLAGWSGGRDDDELAPVASTWRSQLGCNFFDTAWAYGARAQRAAARPAACRGHPGPAAVRRDQDPAEEPPVARRRGLHARRRVPARPHPRVRPRRAWTNLGVAGIDLLQFHVWEDAWADDERWQRAMDDLKREGLIGGVGRQRQPLGAGQRASRRCGPAWSTRSR